MFRSSLYRRRAIVCVANSSIPQVLRMLPHEGAVTPDLHDCILRMLVVAKTRATRRREQELADAIARRNIMLVRSALSNSCLMPLR